MIQTDLKLNQEIKVLTLFRYIKDNWYGTRYRMVLIKDDHTGFKNKRETKEYWLKFVTFMKVQRNWPATNRQLEFDALSKFPTYIYCGAGPSYSCTNMYVTVGALDTWYNNYIQSPAYLEKERERSSKKSHKDFLKKMRNRDIKPIIARNYVAI